jgi:hypothetical protein
MPATLDEPRAAAVAARGNAAAAPSAAPGPLLDIGPVPARLVPLFVFLHVPKTAGSSLRLAMSQMFGPHLRFFTRNEELARTPENEALWADPAFYNRHLLIGGHVRRNHPVVEPTHIGRRIIYISMFRDPVKRAVSGYDFSRRFPDHPIRDFLADKTLFQAVTTPGPFRDRYVNDQIRYVFGTPRPKKAAEVLRAGNYIVAPMEKMEEFFDALSAISGLPRPQKLPRVNTSNQLDEHRIEKASEQPDYEDALTALAEANADEIAFLKEHLTDVVVTTSLRPLS